MSVLSNSDVFWQIKYALMKRMHSNDCTYSMNIGFIWSGRIQQTCRMYGNSTCWTTMLISTSRITTILSICFGDAERNHHTGELSWGTTSNKPYKRLIFEQCRCPQWLCNSQTCNVTEIYAFLCKNVQKQLNYWMQLHENDVWRIWNSIVSELAMSMQSQRAIMEHQQNSHQSNE